MGVLIDKFDGEYAFLSNFYYSPITIGDITYPTVEHYFQAMKTMDINARREIAAAETPGKAKRMGRSVTLRPDWEAVKFDIMRAGLVEKFKIPELREKLLATGDARLKEGTTWHDNIWGSCSCANCGDRGRNLLGMLLENVRAEINNLF